jgi:hypothetical protein
MIKYLCCALWLLIAAEFSTASASQIQNYAKIYMPAFSKAGKLVVIIRIFKRDGVLTVLAVDPNTLETKIFPAAELSLKNTITLQKPQSIQYSVLKNTYYHHLLYQNYYRGYGLSHAKSSERKPILTIDLCPSSKPFEKELFDNLAKQSKHFPVAIAISGMWLIKHQREFDYLLKLQSQEKIDITWVNHSFTHIYYPDLPLKKDFLASEMVDLDTEIMLTEQLLLEQNQIPSVFFRFPGLISNGRLRAHLHSYGLIALSADAWLAKNEIIKPGSIVLVHGNGNEPLGIKLLLSQLSNRQWGRLVPIIDE